MESNIKESIIKTLAYYDIFDFPLTLSEIRKYSSIKYKISDSKLMDEVSSISIIQQSNSFYYFLGRSDIVTKRLERSDLSIQKFGKARLFANIISKIPTVEYIGITGNLAIGNSSSSDNIDFLIITSKKSLWLTKLFIDVILKISKQIPDNKSHVYDRINTAIIIDKNNLKAPISKINLCFAHEIVQLRTVFQKNSSQNEFLNSNKWISNYLPNVLFPVFKEIKKKRSWWENSLKITEPVAAFLNKTFFRNQSKLQIVSSHFVTNSAKDKEKIVNDLYKIKSQKYLKLYEDDMWIDGEDAKYYLDEKKVRILN